MSAFFLKSFSRREGPQLGTSRSAFIFKNKKSNGCAGLYTSEGWDGEKPMERFGD